TNMNRRTFLTALAAASLAARKTAGASISRVGLQLYTVRVALEKDFDGTLAKVAAIGYKEVEFAGYFGHTPQQVRAALKKHRLTSPPAPLHHPPVTKPEKWARALDDAAAMGQKFLVTPWIDEPVRNQP